MSDSKNARGPRPLFVPPPIAFPPQNSPRTWLLSSSLSPLHTRLIRALLAHGDQVAACLPPHEMDDRRRSAGFRALVAEARRGGSGGSSSSSSSPERTSWRERLQGIRCDARMQSQCEAAVAQAVETFGRVDVVVCSRSEVVVGTLPELSATPATRVLAREQFDVLFTSQTNFIRAAFPTLKAQQMGHILVLTSTASQVPLPGLGAYAAATRALEAWCASMAFDLVRYDVRVTVMQPALEVQALTGEIIFAPVLEGEREEDEEEKRKKKKKKKEEGGRKSVREVLAKAAGLGEGGGGGAMARVDDGREFADGGEKGIVRVYAQLGEDQIDALVLETVHAIAAIGGHENPPTRHVVGHAAAIEVRERMQEALDEVEAWVGAEGKKRGGGGSGGSSSKKVREEEDEEEDGKEDEDGEESGGEMSLCGSEKDGEEDGDGNGAETSID